MTYCANRRPGDAPGNTPFPDRAGGAALEGFPALGLVRAAPVSWPGWPYRAGGPSLVP